MDLGGDLVRRKCEPRAPGSARLPSSTIDALMGQLDGWQRDGQVIRKTFHFRDYCRTMAFVNAVAWLAHNEDHHPTLSVSYDKCLVEYSTHSIGGLSENDFICAAKVDALIQI